MHSKHKLGHASPNTRYYSHCLGLHPNIHKEYQQYILLHLLLKMMDKHSSVLHRYRYLFYHKHAVRS